MAPEKVMEAFRACRAKVAPFAPARYPADEWVTESKFDYVQELIAWLCEEGIKLVEIGKVEKAMRWLGFVQGAIWSWFPVTIDELKSMNRTIASVTEDPWAWTCADCGQVLDQSDKSTHPEKCPGKRTSEPSPKHVCICGKHWRDHYTDGAGCPKYEQRTYEALSGCGMCDGPLPENEITWGASRYCSMDCVTGAQKMAEALPEPAKAGSRAAWRQGYVLGRVIYRDDVCVGMVDDESIAQAICEAMNAAPHEDLASSQDCLQTYMDFVPKRVKAMAMRPGMWGGPRAVETQLRLLLDLESVLKYGADIQPGDIWRRALRELRGENLSSSLATSHGESPHFAKAAIFVFESARRLLSDQLAADKKTVDGGVE